MKASMQNEERICIMAQFYRIVKDKIKDARRNGTYHIKNEPGSRRASWCPTLGCYSVNIKYNYYFADNPERKNRDINSHFWGYDTWDFEYKKVK